MAKKLSLVDISINLRFSVDEIDVGASVVELLLPGGQPHGTEGQLWDYKASLPSLAERPSDDQRKLFAYELGCIIKDVVSFHNAYGGYILFGVADKGKSRLKGIGEAELDCGDLNRRLKSYVGDAEIECHFAKLEGPNDVVFGLLHVPRRASNRTPVRFQKEGPLNLSGQRAFGKETYVRVMDECRPAASTSSDWAFLHSDRSPLETKAAKRSRKLPTNLPARDPDLVEFVGREALLSKLREWMSDQRSPIRLVTGIGGLGKTALVYRFAEEVADLAAGEVEQVVWLTAKVQTYSVLKGKLVPTGRVDFNDAPTLYRAILRAIKYELPIEEDDVDIEYIEERVIEGLSFEPSLIIVDDVDSLSPEEQKTVVASLNNIAIRTVGRELPSSKIVVTSRIDQGMSGANVIKLSGLERSAFDRYVENLCRVFDITPIYGQILNDLYSNSSGSPLFAGSIARLVKLGENAGDVIEKWSGQDGEEVRAFAFEREIERLQVSELKLLLAVILLGETSIEDLSDILGVSIKVVRERVAALQAYHLISSVAGHAGQNVIVAQSELVAITELLKKHLGGQASSVEEACARAVQVVEGTSTTIGHGIRNIANLWKSERFGEAVLASKKLRLQFPKSADVACVYGASLLKTSPQEPASADRELREARILGCQRPELLPYTIQAKELIEDWQGIIDVTVNISFNTNSHDIALDAYLNATRELLRIADVRGDASHAVELAVAAVDKIEDKVKRQKLSANYFQGLMRSKNDLAVIAIRHQRRLLTSAGDALSLFECVARLADSNVFIADVIDAGIDALITWWEDVERRPMIDRSASEILAKHLRRLDKIERAITALSGPNERTLTRLSEVSHDLGHRGATYSG